jgi:hypothetical protein
LRIAFKNGLDIVDISNLNNPTLISNYKTAGQGKGIEIEDNKAFIADGEAGLTVVDTSDLNNPVLADDFLYYYKGFATNVELVDNTAYVSNWILGLEIIDISNPIDSNLLGNYDSQFARQTTVSGDLAFIINADLDGGLEIVDISDPNNPQLISYFESLGDPWNVTIRDNTAFIGDGAAGVTIVDISNPNNPTLISNFDTNGTAYRVELVGDIAFISDDSNGIVILDISNLNNPTLINTITEVNTAYDIEVVNNIAFVNDANLGGISQLKIFDISNLNNPTLLSSIDLESGVYDLAVEGNIAAVADYDAGVHIIDISDLNNPTILSTYADYNPDLVDVWAYYAEAVKIVEDTMFVAYGGGGFHVVDISDPSSPQQLYEDQYIPYSDEIEISDNKAYISTQDKGVKILDVSEFLAGNSNNNPPIITEEISDQNVIVNSEFTLNIENNFTDSDGDQLTYTVANLPTWLTFNGETRTFSGIPTELGNVAITVTVSDGKDQVSDTFNLNIKNKETPTIFSPITINNNLFGGAGDNIINNTSSNSNRVYSGLGNDSILAGENDRIFGGNGNDILDASQGNGGNRLFAGAGNDTLIAGDGNDILVGGEGADKFTIADTNLPTNYNLILDFETGDQVVIKNLNVTFADITISNGTKGAELKIPSLGQEAIAIFPNLDANTLNNVNNFEIS